MRKSVYWPDGTKGAAPSDGFLYFDRTGTPWQWDDALEKWVRGYGGTSPGVPGDIDQFSTEARSEVKCDCGAMAVGSDRHSSWCSVEEARISL